MEFNLALIAWFFCNIPLLILLKVGEALSAISTSLTIALSISSSISLYTYKAFDNDCILG